MLQQRVHARQVASARPVQRLASHESPRWEDVVVVPDELSSDLVRRKESAEGYFAPRYTSSAISRRLDARSGAGEQLEPRLREEFQPWFGRALDTVRIHRDAEADRLSQSISARAFTTGQDVYFASGEYRPQSSEGRRVIAHELAHVMQQARGHSNDVLRRLSEPIELIQSNVRPWQNELVSGDDYWVATDAGTRVPAWTGYSPWALRYQYFCHGHTLGTFENYGYSVYSGDPGMKQVLNDEWRPVPSSETQSGDIAVWMPTREHSCRVVAPTVVGGRLDPNGTTVTSKDGNYPLATKTLKEVMDRYQAFGSPEIYRNR